MGVKEKWSVSIPGEEAFRRCLDRDYIFDLAGRLSEIGTFELGFKPAGSKSAHRAAELIADEMRAIGLQQVVQEPFPVHVWDFSGARLEIGGWDPIPACAFPPTPGTPPQGLAADVIDVGGGTWKDYEGLDIQGKIAFMRYDASHLPWVGTMAYEAELHGAAALAFYYLNGYAQHESGEALNVHNGTARETIPVVQIPRRYGERIAESLERGAVLPAILHSAVEVTQEGTGYNVLGQIPGRLRDRYILVGAHYDAWFSGYWDNAVGVGAILAIAKSLLDSGYQPEHTLIFLSTDAEESGAADTQFDWLIGCMNMLAAHPEWHGRVSAALNIDTLPPVGSPQMGFNSFPELMPFIEQATGDLDIRAFPIKQVEVVEKVTAWTEALAYAYFGIPPMQPMFRLEELSESIYHTQFDDASVVDRPRGIETVECYGSLLVRLDRQPVLPYAFEARVQSLRRTVARPPCSEAEEEIQGMRQALDHLGDRAAKFERWLAALSPEELAGEREAINDRLREAACLLTRNMNYLDGAEANQAQPLHVFYDRDLRAFEAALGHLSASEAEAAITALTDPETGLQGASWALRMSYPVWYRHAFDGSNPGRADLFWGKNRTARVADVCGILHSLQDKITRGINHFGAEAYLLAEKRQAVLSHYRQALRDLSRVLEQASELLER